MVRIKQNGVYYGPENAVSESEPLIDGQREDEAHGSKTIVTSKRSIDDRDEDSHDPDQLLPRKSARINRNQILRSSTDYLKDGNPVPQPREEERVGLQKEIFHVTTRNRQSNTRAEDNHPDTIVIGDVRDLVTSHHDESITDAVEDNTSTLSDTQPDQTDPTMPSFKRRSVRRQITQPSTGQINAEAEASKSNEKDKSTRKRKQDNHSLKVAAGKTMKKPVLRAPATSTSEKQSASRESSYAAPDTANKGTESGRHSAVPSDHGKSATSHRVRFEMADGDTEKLQEALNTMAEELEEMEQRLAAWRREVRRRDPSLYMDVKHVVENA